MQAGTKENKFVYNISEGFIYIEIKKGEKIYVRFNYSGISVKGKNS